MNMLDGFVKFMAENVQKWHERLKVLSYAVCSMERQQGHWGNLRFINRRLFQLETP